MTAFNLEAHCKANKIRIEPEGEYDVIFIAPRGKKFGNGTNRRIVEDINEVSDRELESILIV